MKSSIQTIIIIAIFFIVSTGCKGQNNQLSTITSTQSITPKNPTTLPTMEMAQEVNLATNTPTIITDYQLTYVSEGQNIYGKKVASIENGHICFGEEKLLISIQNRKGVPSFPISDHSWSPDGQMIAICATGIGDKDDIFWTNVRDINWENITNSKVYECSPNWTPDGRGLIYDANSYELYGGHKIISSNLNGQDKIPLLIKDTLGDEGQVALSPDGNRLAFIHSDDNGFYQIYITNLDGTNKIQLTDLPAHNDYPSFSPDGKWIVFHRQTDPYAVTNQYDNSRNRIVVMNIETKEEFTIISGKNAIEEFVSPSWAPFGDWIAFSSNYEGSYNIYIIKTDGKGLMRITTSQDFESNPKWRIYTEP